MGGFKLFNGRGCGICGIQAQLTTLGHNTKSRKNPMDRLEDYFWDFLQDRLPYSLYDALYTFASHVSMVFYGLNSVFTYAYKAA